MKIKLFPTSVPVVFGALVLFGVMSCSPNQTNRRLLFAKAWSGRLDRAIEFHLQSRPEARYLLLVPPNYDPAKKHELWITLHGIAGASEDALCEWYWYAKDRNAILLAPQGVHQIRNRKTPHLAYWEFDKDPEAIVQVIDDVCENYNVNRDKLVVFGTSSGADMAMCVASRIPKRIEFMGLYGYRYDKSTKEVAFIKTANLTNDASHISLFFGRGLSDAVLKDDTVASISALKSIGFKIKGVNWPGLEHDDRDFRDETLRYLDVIRGHPQKAPSWTFDLAGKWKAKFVKRIAAEGVCHDDSGISQQAKPMVLSCWDDKNWQEVPVPAWRTKWEGDWSGDRWSGETIMRKEIHIPARLAGQDLKVNLGLLESLDNTYFNGHEVGRTNVDDPYWLWKPRTYIVSGKLVHAGKNILAVRFFDRCGGGGITHAGPGELCVTAD